MANTLPPAISFEFESNDAVSAALILEDFVRRGYREVSTTRITRTRIIMALEAGTFIPPPLLPAGARGVDVSRHQGIINWPLLFNSPIEEVNPATGVVLKRHKVRFASLRCTMSATGTDDRFPYNWTETGKLSELFREVYHYWRPEDSPGPQIDNLWRATGGDFGNMSIYPDGKVELYTGAPGQPKPGPKIDVEPRRGETFPVTQRPRMTSDLLAFLEGIQRRADCLSRIYSNRNGWLEMTALPAWVNDYSLHVASYRDYPPSMPAGWERWDFWQYSERGHLPGHESEYIDLDIYNGGWTPTAPPPVPGAVAWIVAVSSASVRARPESTAPRVGSGYVFRDARLEQLAENDAWVQHAALGVAGWTLKTQLRRV